MFSPEEFHRLGTRIVAAEPTEAGYRTGINRSYYACYLIGAEAASARGWFNSKGGAGDHSGLRRAFKTYRGPLAQKLAVLYQLREHADYHTGAPDQPTSEGCSYCRTGPSVDQATWEDAKAIADDILPRLKAIATVR